MVFTKYMSFCLVSPQSGLRPVFLINIYHMDTKNTSSHHVFDHSQNNKCRSLRFIKQRNEVHSNTFHWCVMSEADRFHIVWVTSSLVTDPYNASKFQQLTNMHINIPPLTLVPSLSSNCPLFLSLLFPPPPFPSVLRCRDPSARWCITKDTCSVDVARQIDCVLVSVRVFVYACIYSFISF